MIETLTVKIQLGVHAGVAAKLFHISKQYNNHAFIKFNNKRASIMDVCRVLSLGIHCGDEIILIVDGENEQEHLNELKEILNEE